MNIRETCVLTFATSESTLKNVRINNPRPGLSPADLIPVIDTLTSADLDVFDDTIGGLVSLISAVVQTETITEII